MIRLQTVGRSFADLLELRATLRRQATMIAVALSTVQDELRDWQADRDSRLAAGGTVSRELLLLWDDLEARERELAADLLQVQAALGVANAEVAHHTHRARPRAG